MRVSFDQCDSTDEIVGLFNKIFANQDQMEAKIIQNAKEIEALKIKKKGKKKMKSKGSVLTRTLAILMLVVAIAGLCYAAYVPGDINYDIASNPETLAIYLRDVTNNMRSSTYVFEPRAAAPALPAEGMVYYNSGTDNWVGYTDPGGWQNFDVAGGVNLNGAYDFGVAGGGRTILANDDAVVISNAEADAADLLQLTYTGAVAGRALVASANGTEPVIEIENTGTGYDIEGTGATWYATDAGLIVGTTADFTAAGGITLQNDETITNPNGSITFTDTGGNTLIFDLDNGATSILIDSGDVVTLDWGTVDNFTSVQTITFDQEDGTITLDANADGEDLLITQTANAGAQDASLDLRSAGTGDDSIIVRATTGGIDVDSVTSIVLTSVEDEPDAIVIQATLGGIDIRTDNAGAGHDIDIGATLGSVNILATENAASAITMTTNGGISETIVITNTQGAGADAITLTGTAGGIDIDAVDDIIITVASTAAADDLALVQTGAVNASITMAAAGTGADAIDLNASAGGIDIDAAAAITIDNAAGDVTFTSAAGSVVISASEDATDAIDIDSTAGGIDIDAAGEAGQDIIITNTGGSIALVATESAVNSIVLQSTLGGIDIQCDAATSEDIDIRNTGGSVNLYATENAADSVVIQSTLGGIDIRADASGDEDIDISNTGGNVHIASDADATDAFDLDVTGTNGGVDIDTTDGPIIMTTAGAINGDVTIDASDKISIISSDAAAAGILLQVDGGAAETIHINSTAGTTASAIYLDADVGGITLLADGDAAGDILIDAEDRITLTTEDEHAGAITIHADTGAAASTIIVTNTAGTAVSAAAAETAAIQLYADAGGIGLNSGVDADNAIRIESDGGDNETIVLHSNQGTGDDSFVILSDEGGIDIDAAKVINIQGDLAAASAIVVNASAGGFAIDGNGDSSTITLTSDAAGEDLTIAQDGAADGQIILDSVGTALDSIYLHEHSAGVGGGIKIHSDTGTGVSAASASVASIQLLSDDGGIGLLSNANLANAIRIEADGGANETVNISSIKGTGAASIDIDSLVGGVTISTNAAAKDVIINSVLGTISLLAEETGAAQAMSIVADGDATTGVWIQSVTGTSVTEDSCALEIRATAGGIAIQSDANLDDALVLRVDGGTTSEMTITNDQGNTSDSIEIVSVAGGVTIAGGADDNITMTTGAAGGAAGNVVFTNGQTRKTMFYPKHVELDGTNPPALSDIGTDAQVNVSVLQFDANPDTTGDDMCYISWRVPDGYITDSARLNIGYSFSTAEAAADECQFDFVIEAVAPGELIDAAGTALADQTTVIAAANTDNGKLHVTQYNIDGTAEVIAVDDLVTIKILVDEDDCAMDASGTLDVSFFEIEWESSE